MNFIEDIFFGPISDTGRKENKSAGNIEKKQKQETKTLFIHVIIFQLQYKL